jgi:uncharacterized membrane protein
VEDTVAIATIALILHILSAVVWVGGMFLRFVLRPAQLRWHRARGSIMAGRVRALLSLGVRRDLRCRWRAAMR